MTQPRCDLCESEGGRLVLSNEWLRVVLPDEPSFPGFVRVIWHDHVRELTDLAAGPFARLMQTVRAVEQAQREVLRPAKVNVASLGNVTPHLHWHLIPRFADDTHFPQPVWGSPQRAPDQHTLASRRGALDALRRRIAELVARVPRAESAG